MSNQLQITGGAKVRNLEGVITGTSGVLSSVPLGGANGVATLDSGGKVPVSQLPSSVVTYLGTWNAATNTPTLTNGTGDAGDMYICNVAGTVNFGAGPITFAVGDWVLYGSGTWQKSSGQNGTVTSVGLTAGGNALTISNSPIVNSGNINVGFAGSSTQYIAGDGTLVTFPTLITEAQTLITDVYNETGATLTKGTVVYINGGHGNLPTVTKAIATGDSTSAQTYGVVQADITNNNNGHVVVIGSLGDLDTQAYAAGTQLYLSSTTAGAWTSTKQYAPAHLVYVGIVVRSHPTQGVVEIKIQNGFELDELHNVSAQSPSNGNILQYNSTTSLWTAVAGTTTNIAEGTNLYYTDARSRAAFSETVTGLDYNSTTGVLSTTIGYGIPTTANQTNWTTAYNDSIVSAAVTGTTTKTLTLTQQDGGTVTASWSDYDTAPVTSVFGRTGAVTAQSGDYTTTLVTEGTNLYFTNARSIASTLTGYVSGAGTISSTDSILTAIQKLNGNVSGLVTGVSSVFGRTGAVVAASGDYTTTQVTEGSNLYFTNGRARGALSFTAGSGAYNSTTGVITIPTNTNQLTNGASFITLTSLSAGTGISYNNTTGVISSTITQYTDAMARAAISLTTTGTSGAATYNSTTGVLNIPNYSETTFGTVTSVGLSSATSGVTIGSSPITTSGTITLAIATASGTQQGLLSSTDWNTFNGKQNTITLTTTGTSGAATLVGSTLNIPNYGSALSGYLPLTGGTLTGALSGTSATFSGDVTIGSSGNSNTLNINSDTSIVRISGLGFSDNRNYGSLEFYNTDGSGAGANVAAAVRVNSVQADGSGGYLTLHTSLGTESEGTPAPTRLTIDGAGAATFSSSVTANALNFSSVYSTATGDGITISSNGATAGSGNFGAGLVFTQVAGGSRRAAIAPVQGTADNDTVGLAFFTHPSATGATDLVEQFRIAYNGAATFSSSVSTGSDLYVNGNSVIGNSNAGTPSAGTTRLTLQNTTLTNSRGIGFYANDGTQNPRSWIKHITASGSQYMEFSSDYSTGSSTSNWVFLNGNVGIGTSSPSQKLEVAGVIRGEAVNVYGSTDPASTSPYLYSPSLGALGFGGNGSIKMTMTSGGNLLINTTTDAGYKLDVNGTARISGALSGTSATFTSLQVNGAQTISNAGSGDYLTIQNTDPSIGGGETVSLVLDYTQAASSTGWKILSRYAGGNLQFVPNKNNAGYNTYALSLDGTSGAATFSSSVTAGGLITIGNFDGQALKFQSATSTGSSYLRFYNSAGTARGYLGLFWNGSSDYMVYDAGALQMNFNSSNSFTFTGGGAATFSSSVTMAYSGNPRLTLQDIDSGAGNVGILFKESTNDKWTLASVGGAFQFFNEATASNAMYISSANNVGIGTTSPSYPLHVYGAASNGQFVVVSNVTGTGYGYNYVANQGGLQSLWGSETNGAFIGTNSNHYFYFLTNGSERMRITSGGNVGIGTTSPASKLDVAGGIVTTNGAGTTYNQFANSGNDVIWENRQNGAIIIRSNSSTERMRIASGGNVLIGTTTDAGYKLYVNGSMYVTGAATYAGGVSYSGIQTFNNTVNLNSNTNVAVNQNIVWKGTTSASDFSMGNGGLGMYILSSATIDLNAPITQRVGLGYTFAGSSTTYNVQLLNSNISNDELTIQGAVRMNSTTAGFIPPRMTTTQANALSARGSTYCPNGTMIFDTTINIARIWNGTAWMNLW